MSDLKNYLTTDLETATISRSNHDKENPYVMIKKASIQDKDLTIDARGLLAYLLSLPDNWTINLKHLKNEFKIGYIRIKTTIDLLCKFGYMKKIKLKDEKHTNLRRGDKYILSEEKGYYLGNLDIRIPSAQNPENETILSNKEKQKTKKDTDIKEDKEKGTTPLKPPSSQDVPKNIVKKNRPNLIKVKENIWLTPEELEKLKNLTTEQNLNSLLEDMEDYQYARNKPYANHYRALLKWIRNQFKSQQRKGPDNFSDNKWEAPKADATIEL